MKTGFKGVQNLNGRPPGSKNSNTAEIRERFNMLVQNNIDKLQKDIADLEPFQRIKIILELAKFILPTLKSIELTPPPEEKAEIFNSVIVKIVNDGNNDQ
jgi:hypothetical protein